MILTTEYTKGAKARAVPGAYYLDRSWHIDQDETSPRAARIILKLFPALVATEPWLATRAKEGLEGRPVDKATEYSKTPGWKPISQHATRVAAIMAAKDV